MPGEPPPWTVTDLGSWNSVFILLLISLILVVCSLSLIFLFKDFGKTLRHPQGWAIAIREFLIRRKLSKLSGHRSSWLSAAGYEAIFVSKEGPADSENWRLSVEALRQIEMERFGQNRSSFDRP
ncbi:MAG: hypothetical protein RJA81_701 [Planctomycetota bacterium]